MDKNAKIERIAVLRKKQARHVAALAEIEMELCPLMSGLLCDHGPDAGVDDATLIAASAPKDDGGK